MDHVVVVEDHFQSIVAVDFEIVKLLVDSPMVFDDFFVRVVKDIVVMSARFVQGNVLVVVGLQDEGEGESTMCADSS